MLVHCAFPGYDMNHKNLFRLNEMSEYLFLTCDYLNLPCNFVCFIQDIPLGGWSVERSVDGEPPVIYMFNRKLICFEKWILCHRKS